MAYAAIAEGFPSSVTAAPRVVVLQRALLWLAHVEGSSHEEIAESIGVKAKSVKVMLFRARKRLGELLTKKGLAP